MEYQDFDLLISMERGAYRARVLYSPEGLSENTEAFKLPFEEGELEVLLRKIGQSRGEGRELDLKDGELQDGNAAQELGEKLYRALFIGEVRDLFQKSLAQTEERGEGLRILLHLTNVPILSNLPWEFLHDGRRFLTLSLTTPVLRFIDLSVKVRSISSRSPLRILGVVTNPFDQPPLAVEREWLQIEEALKPLVDSGKVILDRVKPPTLQALRKKLARQACHVLHFIGHGRAGPGRGVLIFEDKHGHSDRVSGEQLGQLLYDHQQLRLVVLNACEGGCEKTSFTGVAQSLIQHRIPAVVAMQRILSDEAAITFAQSFYEELAQESPVDVALTQARLDLRLRSEDDVEWGTPVIYLRSSDEIVLIKPPSTEELTGSQLGLSEWTRFWNAHRYKLLTACAGIVLAAALTYTILMLPPPDSPDCPPSRVLAGLEFARIPKGKFIRGSKRSKEEPLQEVAIGQPYCLARHEVTQGQWKAVMGTNPSANQENDDLPVENVSWMDTQEFLAKLNELEPESRYRLATEAEWEYAARAGSGASYSFGDEVSKLRKYGNCKGENDAFDGTAPVGSFNHSAWGLYDMYGNVSEWVADWQGPYLPGTVKDPKGADTGERKVRRGGSWDIIPENCDSADRTDSAPTYRSNDVGFRLVRDLKPAKP